MIKNVVIELIKMTRFVLEVTWKDHLNYLDTNSHKVKYCLTKKIRGFSRRLCLTSSFFYA